MVTTGEPKVQNAGGRRGHYEAIVTPSSKQSRADKTQLRVGILRSLGPVKITRIGPLPTAFAYIVWLSTQFLACVL